MKDLPQIYKKANRCSRESMPDAGQRCMFSHALQLTLDEFVPQKKLFEREEIHQGARCEVKGFISPSPNVVIVKFEHADQMDLVSPEFLIPLELTVFGRGLVKSDPRLLAIVEDLTYM